MTYEMPPEGGGPGRAGAGRPGRGGVGRLPRYNGFRRRGPLVPTILALILAVIAFLIFANFYTDWLWYRSIGAANVFTTRLRTQATLFVVFGVLTGGTLALNAWLAFRFRPAFRGLSVEQQSLERYRVSVEPFRRFITPVVGLIIGLMAGSSAAAQWRSWLLFRNSVPFGAKDPQFHMDVSFFAFRLPFYRYLLGFGFAIVLLSLVVTLAVNYLYGGIKIQTPGERLTPAARVHVSVLLGIFVLLKAIAYWFDRFSLVLDQHHLSGGNTASSFTGASYTDIRAILPAKNILLGVALICAVLFFVNVWRKTWQLPALGLGLLVFSAVVIGGIYPATVQYFTVRPSEPVREAPYIQRNIDATRTAYDIADVTPQSYTPNGAITAKAAAAATAVTPDVRLLDPVKVQAAFQNKQQSRGYYNFADPLDIDRYIINGQELVSLVAVRELDPTRIGGSDQNWANLHTVYTHGFGFVAAAGNAAQADGTPSFYEKDVPPVGPITISQPRVYFGEDSSNYAIVGARKGAKGQELDYADSTVVGGQVNTTYTGNGGVSVGSAFRKTLFAVKFKDSNLLLSSLVNSNSKILWDRTPRQRVEKAAPWLRLDGDPYPAVVNGRIVWILDGYTSTNGYPYAQRTALGDVTQDSFTQSTTATSVVAQQQDSANYIRNSVKATVDAYDGTVTLYEWNQTKQPDPVLRVWEKAFPGSVKPDSAISPELRMHFRYPEDLFKIQRDILSRYHVLTASAFYGGQDFWAVPEDPTVDTNPPPQPPYYVQVQMPGQTAATFSLTTTLAPRAKTQAAAFMAVDSDPGQDYGKIRVLEFPTETNTPGPQQVQNNFEGSAEVSTTLSLLRTKGSTVLFGNLLTLPLAGVNGLLYVEPVYVARASGSASASFPLLQRVLVSYGESIGFKETLALSLDEVFSTTTPGGPTPPVTTPQGENAALAQALADAQAAIAAGQTALDNHDFAAYGKAQTQLADAVAAAVAAEQALTPSSSPSASPGTSSSTTSSPIASASG